MDHAAAQARHEEMYDDPTGAVVNKLAREAFDYYREAAASGNAHAQFCVGLLHEDLDSVYDNSEEYWGDAFSLDIKFDKNGNPVLRKSRCPRSYGSAVQVGTCLPYRPDLSQEPGAGPRVAELRGPVGHRFAACLLGEMYLKGEGVPQDFAKARSWLEQAAGQGSMSACYSLARIYGEGLGVTRDAARRDFWHKMAAVADVDE